MVAGSALPPSNKATQPPTGSGGLSIHLLGAHGPAPMPRVMSNLGPLMKSTVDEMVDMSVLGVNDIALDKAERRHVKMADVDIAWELTWASGQLEVRVFGEHDSQPFQFYVVVEETVYSGETQPEGLTDILGNAQLLERIHTAFAAEMVNQLVLVPEAFFEEEHRAIAAAAKKWKEFVIRFAKSGPPGPGDPIQILERSIDERLRVSPSTSTLISALDDRVEFAMQYAPHIWTALHETEQSILKSNAVC